MIKKDASILPGDGKDACASIVVETLPANKAPIIYSTASAINLSPSAQVLVEGVVQGRVNSFNFGGWFNKFWLLHEDQKNALWVKLSQQIDPILFQEFQRVVKERERQAMADLLAKRNRKVRR